MATLYEQYKSEIVPELMGKSGYKNLMEVPKLSKMVISSGIGTGKDRDVFDEAIRMFGEITGQRPIIAKARTNVAGFKLRQGNNVGVYVTLRGQRMYDFFCVWLILLCPGSEIFEGFLGNHLMAVGILVWG